MDSADESMKSRVRLMILNDPRSTREGKCCVQGDAQQHGHRTQRIEIMAAVGVGLNIHHRSPAKRFFDAASNITFAAHFMRWSLGVGLAISGLRSLPRAFAESIRVLLHASKRSRLGRFALPAAVLCLEYCLRWRCDASCRDRFRCRWRS